MPNAIKKNSGKNNQSNFWVLPLVLLSITSLLIVFGLVYGLNKKSFNEPNRITPSPEAPVATEAAMKGPDVMAQKSIPDLSMDSKGLSKATAVLNTVIGIIKFKFYPGDAPNTVNRIIELINNGFYNGLTFHRVVPGFVIQGGDPTGTGAGGSGMKLKAEFNNRRHIEGTVAMARASDPDSADSQFYISLGTHPRLDRSYTVFGQVTEGMDVAMKIRMGDKIVKAHIE
ncbi:MAG: peptidylprolyl isomerase [Candidatus Poribacteria bacterium]